MDRCIESIKELLADGYTIDRVLVSPRELLTIQFSKNCMTAALPFRGAAVSAVEQYLKEHHAQVHLRLVQL